MQQKYHHPYNNHNHIVLQTNYLPTFWDNFYFTHLMTVFAVFFIIPVC